ncbi:tetratricopeptide repeat protein [Candidatus Protochlamydia phocaeensis]|uniref:tetratricopeptide repeat protein n=1 Tax=Candidatus Protochlamydia phocaeensis TaxID=1414722 RepID=UPI00083853A6|nr:tetratricopeptide repeat protein [Candidatus Protochlamydia phocaeensis]
MTPIHQALIDIQNSQNFEKLEGFKDSTVWTSMKQEERALLARLLIIQGAQQLSQGNHRVLESFNVAAQVSDYSPVILHEQGVIFASYTGNMRCLALAHQAFMQVIEKEPLLFDAWYKDALVLIEMGIFEGESHYFSDAHQRFEKAHSLLGQAPSSLALEEFYWKWGVCLASLGKYSGEPLDFHQAIEKYQQADKLGCHVAAFFNDYGHALADLASLLHRQEYFSEALKLFNQAVRHNPQSFEGWYNQACCILRLTEAVVHEKLLEQADASFAKAAELNPNNSMLWLKWGQLETALGKYKRDFDKLEHSLEKFAKANKLEPDHPQILSCWAETELFLGAQHERLDLIQSARLKILKSLEIHPESSDTWYLYGSCLNELGRYFSEEDYYNQAIEKFQYGLSLSRQNPLLWYGMALAHFALGELTDQEVLFEKAVRYCAHVIECGGGSFAQFWNDWGVALMKLAEVSDQAEFAEQAIEKFEHALKQPLIDLENEDVDLEWIYNYGCAFDLLGDLAEEPRHFEKAIQILTHVLQLDPDYTQARYNLALALSHLGEAMFDVEPYYKAMEHFQFLLEQDPEDEIIHMDFGISLINLALLVHDIHHPERSHTLYRQAEHHLMQAASLGNNQAFYQLAGLYSLTSNYSHAMHYIEKAQLFGVLPAIEDLLHDDWLEGLRQTTPFRQFIAELSSQSKDEK